jgi:hypothetical protein
VEAVSHLEKRLRYLGKTTEYGYDEWAEAARYLGDHAEALLPAVERMTGWPYSPLNSAKFARLQWINQGRP